jgi:predicted enzyme related to lactoylglutathione lyase
MSNAVNWFEIAGPATLLDFYRDLLGWAPSEPVVGFHMVETDQQSGNAPGISGAIDTRAPTGSPYALCFVEVDNVEKAVEKVEELGGAVVVPPADSGPVRLAHVADPAGNHLGLYHQKA